MICPTCVRRPRSGISVAEVVHQFQEDRSQSQNVPPHYPRILQLGVGRHATEPRTLVMDVERLALYLPMSLKLKLRNKATILVPGSKSLEGAPSSVCAVAGRGSS